MNLALAGLIVLIIGDSHLAAKDFLLGSLHTALEAQGANVESYGVCGSAPHDWVAQTTLGCGRGERHGMGPAEIEPGKVRTWSLDALIRRHHPNLVIIELGDNMAGYGVLPDLPRDWIAQQVNELLLPVEADHLPCLWVGPAWGSEGGPSKKTYARVKELSEDLATLVSPPCHYINSLTFSQPGQWPTLDGEHLTPDSYQIWGNDIAGEVVKYAARLPRH